MKLFLSIAVVLLLLVVLAVGVGSYMLYKLAAKRSRPIDESVWERLPSTDGMPSLKRFEPDITDGRKWLISAAKDAERVSITSFDGLRLNGRIIPCQGRISPRGVILMMHGYRSNPVFDFGASARDFAERGFVLCMPCQRAHGDSEGRHLTYGIKERYDALEWCRFLEKRFSGLPILMCGISMGSSTVLMASSLDLPKAVVGIIADCGYTTPAEICRKVLNVDLHLPAFPLYYTSHLFTRLMAGFSFGDVSALEEASKTELPIMLIHGTDDAFVPYEMGERIRDAVKSPCFFVSAKGAGHGESYLADREGYDKAFYLFLDACGIGE